MINIRHHAREQLIQLVVRRSRASAIDLLNRYGAKRLFDIPDDRLWSFTLRAWWRRITR